MGYGVLHDYDEEDHPEVVGPARLEWIRARMDLALYDSAAIVQASIPWPEVPWFEQGGLYFLIWQDRICYVGQGQSIGPRLETHYAEGRPIARVAVILGLPKWGMDELEHAYARVWDLPWNAERARCGELDAMPDLLDAARALDRSAVMGRYPVHLTAPVRPRKAWELHVLSFMQAHPGLFWPA